MLRVGLCIVCYCFWFASLWSWSCVCGFLYWFLDCSNNSAELFCLAISSHTKHIRGRFVFFLIVLDLRGVRVHFLAKFIVRHLGCLIWLLEYFAPSVSEDLILRAYVSRLLRFFIFTFFLCGVLFLCFVAASFGNTVWTLCYMEVIQRECF